MSISTKNEKQKKWRILLDSGESLSPVGELDQILVTIAKEHPNDDVVLAFLGSWEPFENRCPKCGAWEATCDGKTIKCLKCGHETPGVSWHGNASSVES